MPRISRAHQHAEVPGALSRIPSASAEVPGALIRSPGRTRMATPAALGFAPRFPQQPGDVCQRREEDVEQPSPKAGRPLNVCSASGGKRGQRCRQRSASARHPFGKRSAVDRRHQAAISLVGSVHGRQPRSERAPTRGLSLSRPLGGNVPASVKPTTKRMRLRYAGRCQSCQIDIPAGAGALYDRATKLVTCYACADGPAVRTADGGSEPAAGSTQELESPHGEQPAEPAAATAEDPKIDSGVAGASARREHERRKASREARIRTAHPRIGGLVLALSDEPQSTTAWAVGARGEELLAKRLDGLVDHGVLTLHDRRIPGTRANIDHIAIAPTGIYVIDAKRYNGRPTLRAEGGLFRARTERLFVGSRDCTKLVVGLHKQMGLVLAALEASEADETPLEGMLCFVEGDWPLIGGSFMIEGLHVLWPKAAAKQLVRPGSLGEAQRRTLHGCLAAAFPSA
jgi:Nuclease-related domain